MDNNSITVQTLQNRLQDNKPVFILDVRPQDQREEWYIPGSTHINAYQDLKDGNTAVLDQVDIPEDQTVVTVCEAGKTSRIAADALREKGLDTRSLQGGMKAWNYAWNIAEYTLSVTGTKIIQVRRAAKGCLSYIIGSGDEAVVIDASLDPEVYMEIAAQHSWKIRYVADTHIHADYISRTRELAERTGAEHIFIENAGVDYSFKPVADQQKVAFGKAEIQVLHTPGHTPESTSFLVDGQALLSGDTLFTDGVGRPDLKADQQEAERKAGKLYESLQRLMGFPENTLVLPAHVAGVVPFDGKMIEATIGKLKQNLALLQLSKEDFISTSVSRIMPKPSNFTTIAALNKQGNYEGYEPADLEAGANRCAIA